MDLQCFKFIFENKLFQFTNLYLNDIMQHFHLLVSTKNYIDNLEIIEHENKLLDLIVIDKFNGSLPNCKSCDFFIICTDFNIILIESSNFIKLSKFFILNEKTTIYCISPEIKPLIQDFFNVKLHFSDENDHLFIKKEIPSFLSECKPKFTNENKNEKRLQQLFWSIVQKSVSGYLIKVAYRNSKYKRISNFKKTNNKDIEIKNDEIIKLHFLSIGCSSHLYKVLNIKKMEICLLKIFIDNDDSTKLYERERDNYLNIHHPLLPKFFGVTEYELHKGLIIEYVEGKTLDQINKNELSKKEIMKIILEIMIILEYLHFNGYVYRDLKHNNIIIDSEKRAILIDFDRMIKNQEFDADKIFTKDFTSHFHAPEIDSQQASPKADIYSLGKLILYMETNEIKEEFTKLHNMCKQCTNLNPNERPNISKLIDIFYYDFFSIINENRAPNEKDSTNKFHGEYFFLLWYLISECHCIHEQINLAKLYENGIYICTDNEQNIRYFYKIDDINKIDYKIQHYCEPDINKSIRYYLLAAEQNDSYAYFKLGDIYFSGKFIKQDICKAIHYFTLSANLNNSDAQFILGHIYYTGEKCFQDINKALFFLSLASNNNYSRAQLYLGEIYFSGNYVQQDINKGLYYFHMSANQNDSDAQFCLGEIYFYGKHVQQDINKGLYYLQMSADQNDSDAQFNLGKIYFDSKFVQQDINKGLYYLHMSAGQNNYESQYYLGMIYYMGEYVQRDVSKAIYYLTLSANNNFSLSQNALGIIYYLGYSVQKDINKAIYYLTLAAKQNDINALSTLGSIYLEGIDVTRDINKAIYYYSIAANLNDVNAQNILGFIFYRGKYTNVDINKSIYYFTLASKQNNAIAYLYLGLIFYFKVPDIDKSLYNLMLSAKQNNIDAQIMLGRIYYMGEYVRKDDSKSFFYYSLAAKQNDPTAQLIIGIFYFNGIYVTRDIKKAIHYYKLSADCNNEIAQFNLGQIYLLGEYVPQDIPKAIHYLTLSSNKGIAFAQYGLGIIYLESINVRKDVNKAINYLTLASNNNLGIAQWTLGIQYMKGENVEKNIKKGISYIMLSSKNGYIDGNFSVGFLYHEGKYLEQDIEKAIHYYKESSSFNDNHAKNNLGIIFMNGFGDKIKPNYGLAIEYFNEAIRQKNDIIAMYNLAYLYVYKEGIENNIDQAISLLIRSLKLGFDPSIALLFSALIKKYNFNIDLIEKELDEDFEKGSEIMMKITRKFNGIKSSLNYTYEFCQKVNYLYDYCFCSIFSYQINVKANNISTEKGNIPDITSAFYEGFGLDLLN